MEPDLYSIFLQKNLLSKDFDSCNVFLASAKNMPMQNKTVQGQIYVRFCYVLHDEGFPNSL